MFETLSVTYIPATRAFQVDGPEWSRVITEELFGEVLADKSTMVNRILCEGAAV